MSIKVQVKRKNRHADTEQFLVQIKNGFNEKQIKNIAEKSLIKFKENTPSNSGLTANSWSYEIEKLGNNWIIHFNNSNIQNGINVALLIENGHATPSGKWVSGRHYIEQTIDEINNEIISKEWEEMTKDEQ